MADLHRQRHAKFSFIDSLITMHPYYIARAFGGLLFLIGAAIGLYNVAMTIRHAPRETPALDYPTSSEALEPAVPAAE